MNPIGSVTNFPQGFANGLSVRGIPLLQMQPGVAFFLNNSTTMLPQQRAGSDKNRGTFLDPFATLNYAVNTACVPGRGDIVFVGPGHAETISSATIAALNCSGVAVIGLGSGNLRPTFTYTTATTSNILVAGANMTLQNLLFVGNFLSVASALTGSSSSFTGVIVNGVLTTSVVTGTINVGATVTGTGVNANTVITAQLTGTAGGAGTYSVNGTTTAASASMATNPTDFSIDMCEFRDTSSVLGFLSIYTSSSSTNGWDRFSLTRSVWNSLSTVSPTVAITVNVAADGVYIADNVMNSPITAVTQGPILMAAGANNLTNFTLLRNRLQRPNTSSSIPCAISCSGTGWSGLAADNYIGAVPSGTGVWINTGTKLSFINNYSQITGAADKSALINPSAV